MAHLLWENSVLDFRDSSLSAAQCSQLMEQGGKEFNSKVVLTVHGSVILTNSTI